jgi:hypothetical protein
MAVAFRPAYNFGVTVDMLLTRGMISCSLKAGFFRRLAQNIRRANNMKSIRDRARKNFPSVLLTLLSIVQAVALEKLWEQFGACR